ncbi:hypothetical protein NMG60_11021145 [Bertholletia excelsa]
MGEIMKSLRPKMVMVPYPAQGHVTPMLQLASAFLSRGFDPVVVTPAFIHCKIAPKFNPRDGITCMSIPDGLDLDDKAPRDFFAIETAMERHMPLHLERLLRKFLEEEDGGGVACVVVDLLASWAIRVADICEVQVAGFWPVFLACYQLISAIPQMLAAGIISETGNGLPKLKGSTCTVPGLPAISTEDLPWMIGTSAARASRFKFWIRTLDRSRTLRWIITNSAPEEPHEYHPLPNHWPNDLGQGYPQIVPVGPLNKHALSTKVTFWEEDMSCLEWLDKQRSNSVVYVSFGSWVSPIGDGKIRSLALALEASGCPFIWVLGLSWREGLPAGYAERVSKQGRIVSWAPQIEVLQHRAVGCYLTHCGWNSTMEAVQCRKPLLCYPVAGDQFVNCAYIVKVWRVGVKMNGFGQRELEECLKNLKEDREITQNLWGQYERMMGMNASSRATAYLTAFLDELKKPRVHSLFC